MNYTPVGFLPPTKRIFALLPNNNSRILQPNETCELIFEPQIVMRIDAFRIPHNVAHKIYIYDIVVGSQCIYASTGNVTGEVFCEKRRKLTLPINWSIMTPGLRCRVNVKNKSKQELDVSGFFVGSSEVL